MLNVIRKLKPESSGLKKHYENQSFSLRRAYSILTDLYNHTVSGQLKCDIIEARKTINEKLIDIINILEVINFKKEVKIMTTIQPMPENSAIIKKAPTIMSLLNSPTFKKQLEAVLPATLTPERLVRIALSEMRMNPKLSECDPMSFAGAIMRCAQIGLEPSSERQLVYLIPFRNSKANRMECNVIVGYRGFLALASKANVYIESDVVYENDDFEFQKGLDTKLSFKPCHNGNRGAIIGAYAMARVVLPDSTIIFVPEFMPKSDIDKIMTSSKSSGYGDSPWKTNYDSMARKTVIRRLFKYIPMSAEIDSAIATDELADRDDQDNAALIVNEIVGQDTQNDISTQTKAEALAVMLENTEDKK